MLAGPEDLRGPRALHPVFFGSFDWHSCVHSHWMLARLLRQHPAMPAVPRVRALFDALYIEAAVAAGAVPATGNVDWAQAQALEYLQACLREAMRLRPAVGLDITRIVPPEGAALDAARAASAASPTACSRAAGPSSRMPGASSARRRR